MSELREIIEQASSDIEEYKHPDLSAVTERLNRLFAAGKFGSIGNYDKIERISFRAGTVEVVVGYSRRSCYNTFEVEFPESVLDADDPIDAISAWAWGERVDAARQDVELYEAYLESAKKRLVEAQSS